MLNKIFFLLLSIIPYLILYSLFYYNWNELFLSLKEGIKLINSINLAINYYIVSFIASLILYIVLRGNICKTIVYFCILSLVLNSVFNNYFHTLFWIFVYVGGIHGISFFFCKKFLKIKKFIEVSVISFHLNFFLIHLFYGLGIHVDQFFYPISCVGIFYFGIILFKKINIDKILFSINLLKPKASSISIYNLAILLVITLFIEYCLMLLNQPILEYDSNVAHIPMMNRILESESIAPNKNIIQMFLVNFHQISAIPFYYSQNGIGLKIFNLFWVLYFIAVFQRLSALITGNTVKFELVILSIISVPLLITNIGTFQYDISLASVFGLSLFFSLRYILFKSKNSIYFLVLSLVMGLFIKLNVLAALFPISLVILYYIIKRNEINRKEMVISGILMLSCISLFFVKSYYYTSELFFPYLYMLKVANPDWVNYGIKDVSALFKALYYVLGFTFTEGYGHYNKFTGGFIYFLASVSILSLTNYGKRFVYLVILGAIYMSVLQTQYARYYIYFLSILPIILVDKRGNYCFISNSIKELSLILLILFQIILIPKMNWWIKLTPESLYAGYNPVKFEEEIRKDDYVKFEALLPVIKSERTFFLHVDFSDRYYYAMKEKGTEIVASTWQSNIDHLFLTATDTLFLLDLKKEGFVYIITPNLKFVAVNDRFKVYYGAMKNLNMIYENELFMVFEL